MSDQSIRVNGVPFSLPLGHPVSFISKRSGKTLAGIDIDFRAEGSGSSEMLENLFSQETVSVDDPFVNRSYQGFIQNATHTYRNGNSARHYCEIRELDVIPEFKTLEIEGHPFPVSKYTENDIREDRVTMYALLRLSEDQFTELNRLFKGEPVQVRRIGVDEEPIAINFGSLYWSKHEEYGTTYYKQIVTLVPTDSPTSKADEAMNRLIESIKASQTPIISMVLGLSARFEALVDELTRNNLINNEKRRELLGESWEELLDSMRIEEIKSQTRRIQDAEQLFNNW